MIHYSQTLSLLTERFPELKGNVPPIQTNPTQLHTVVRAFARLTQELIDLGDFHLVQTCFNSVEKLLSQGNSVLKNAIETSLLFTLHLDWTGNHNPVALQLLPEILRQPCNSIVNPAINA